MNETYLRSLNAALGVCLAPVVPLRRDPIHNVREYLELHNVSPQTDWNELATEDQDQITAAVLEARPNEWAEEDLSEVCDYFRLYIGGSKETRADIAPLLLMALKGVAYKAAQGPFERAQDKRVGEDDTPKPFCYTCKEYGHAAGCPER